MTNSNSLNILIIDDNDNDLNYLYDILQSPGNNIFKAKCKQNSIDLIKQKKRQLLFGSHRFNTIQEKNMLIL